MEAAAEASTMWATKWCRWSRIQRYKPWFSAQNMTAQLVVVNRIQWNYKKKKVKLFNNFESTAAVTAQWDETLRDLQFFSTPVSNSSRHLEVCPVTGQLELEYRLQTKARRRLPFGSQWVTGTGSGPGRVTLLTGTELQRRAQRWLEVVQRAHGNKQVSQPTGSSWRLQL